MFTKNSLLITSLICLSMSAKPLIASDSCTINQNASVPLPAGTTTKSSDQVYQTSTFNFSDAGDSSLEIEGLVCGSNQWSGNTFNMTGTDSSPQQIL